MGNSLPLPPLEQRTIPDLLDGSAAYGLKRPWVFEAQSGKTLAYGDFLEHTAGAARVLAERFPGGSHIAVMLTNTVEFFIVRLRFPAPVWSRSPWMENKRGRFSRGCWKRRSR